MFFCTTFVKPHTCIHKHTQWQAVFRHLEPCHSAHSNENVCVCCSSWDRWVHICWWHLQLDELEVCVCVCWMFEALGSPHTNSLLIRFDRSPLHLCICVCVVALLAVCFSHLHHRKKIQQLFFPSNPVALFFTLFSLQGFVCLSSLCVCFYAFCFIALKGNAPEHPALLIPHT